MEIESVLKYDDSKTTKYSFVNYVMSLAENVRSTSNWKQKLFKLTRRNTLKSGF